MFNISKLKNTFFKKKLTSLLKDCVYQGNLVWTFGIIFDNIDTIKYFDNAPLRCGMNLQYPQTPVMEGIMDLHHDICCYLMAILIFVSYMLWQTYSISSEESYKNIFINKSNLLWGMFMFLDMKIHKYDCGWFFLHFGWEVADPITGPKNMIAGINFFIDITRW